MSTQHNFTINNENDLFKIIEALKHGDGIPITELKFKDWPKYEVKIKGEDFNGGVPTRIMPAFMKLQQSIDKAYALSVYGEPRRLTKDEKIKQRLLFIWNLDQPSLLRNLAICSTDYFKKRQKR